MCTCVRTGTPPACTPEGCRGGWELAPSRHLRPAAWPGLLQIHALCFDSSGSDHQDPPSWRVGNSLVWSAVVRLLYPSVNSIVLEGLTASQYWVVLCTVALTPRAWLDSHQVTLLLYCFWLAGLTHGCTTPACACRAVYQVMDRNKRITKFLNRMLAMTLRDQKMLFAYFSDTMVGDMSLYHH